MHTAETQAKTIDDQNDRISTLQRNLKQIGIDGQVPDLTHLTSSKLLSVESSRSVPLGENVVVLQLRHCELFTQSSAPISIFCLVEFANFKPISTSVVSGFLTDFNFKHSYNVEVTEDFLSLISSGYILVELYCVIAGTQHELMGRGKIPLRKFFDRQQFGGKIDMLALTGGTTLGAVDFELSAQIPFENAANLHMAKMTAAGYMTEATDENDTAAQNNLEIAIFAGSGLESQFEDEEPSCFCTYSFYTYDPCTTNVIRGASPRFNYTMSHRVEENANLHRHLTTDQLTFVVIDNNDQDDDAEDYLGKCDVSLIPLAENGIISGSFALLDPEGAESGSLQVEIKWAKPYRKRHGPIQPVNVTKAQIEEPTPAPRSKSKPTRNSKKLIDSYLQKAENPVPSEPIHVEADVHIEPQTEMSQTENAFDESDEIQLIIEESIADDMESVHSDKLDNTSETSQIPIPDLIEPNSLM